ncbi:MAG: CRISPR-associated endonuclease Cas1 [Lentisphaeria bacterium]|nr:CRISPR-associated endonuclease Cas1 [Lentisphaeria bacterium]
MPTLYLNGHDTEAHCDGRSVEVTRLDHEKDDVKTLRVPMFDIERVVVIGQASFTTALLQRLAREGIPLHLLSGHGRWLGAFYPNANGHALRRLRQYELARGGHESLPIATAAVAAKIRNSRRVLQRLAANRNEAADRGNLDVCNSLQALAGKAVEAESFDALRGFEGYAAALYFGRIGRYFPEDAPFGGRTRRPPRDATNALLSWCYTIVLSEIDAAVRAAGLDPCLGFLHEISYGRPSLSLDLLEPLRAPLCDMLALRLLNHRLLRAADHFETNPEDGGTYLSEAGRRTFFPEYERTMQRRFAAAKGQPHTDFRKVIQEQVNALLRAMEHRADMEFFVMP